MSPAKRIRPPTIPLIESSLKMMLKVAPDDPILYEIVMTDIRSKAPCAPTPKKQPTTLKEWREYITSLPEANKTQQKNEDENEDATIDIPQDKVEAINVMTVSEKYRLALALLKARFDFSQLKRVPEYMREVMRITLHHNGYQLGSPIQVNVLIDGRAVAVFRNAATSVTRTIEEMLFDEIKQREENLNITTNISVSAKQVAEFKPTNNVSNTLGSLIQLPNLGTDIVRCRELLPSTDGGAEWRRTATVFERLTRARDTIYAPDEITSDMINNILTQEDMMVMITPMLIFLVKAASTTQIRRIKSNTMPGKIAQITGRAINFFGSTNETNEDEDEEDEADTNEDIDEERTPN